MNSSFRGKRYKLIESESDQGGECSSPDASNREMVIPIEGETKYDLEVIIHEGLHACFWDVCEQHITRTGKDLANLLWKLGWRKD